MRASRAAAAARRPEERAGALGSLQIARAFLTRAPCAGARQVEISREVVPVRGAYNTVGRQAKIKARGAQAPRGADTVGLG